MNPRFTRLGGTRRLAAVGGLLALIMVAGTSLWSVSGAQAATAGASAAHVSAARAVPDFTSPASAGIGRSRNVGFVTRAGSKLLLDGSPFHFSGTNIYWLGLDENVPAGTVDYPTDYRIRDAIDTAADMGAKVIRSDMLISSGGPLTLLPSKAAGINQQAWATIDYAIAYAGSKGIRLVLPLTDNWTYYHGGIRDFAKTYGLCTDPNADCPDFYSDPRVIADFQSYITTVLNHVDPYTGLALKNDPTVMAWELGNELNDMTPSWIDTISSQLKSEAPHQLVAAGRQFNVDDGALAAKDVDIVDVHYYPPTVASVTADAQTVTAAGKVYLAGEYDSNAASTVLPSLASDTSISGMLSWSLFGHNDTSGFVQHDDGFTFHYPGDDAAMAGNDTAQENYARALGTTPKPTITRAPLITSIVNDFGLHQLAWRGATGATGYLVQRLDGRRWTTLTASPVGDAAWLDTATHGAATYRVVPLDASGHRGPASDPVEVGATQQVTVDAVGSLTPLAAHAGVSDLPYGEDAVIVPSSSNGGSATWSAPALSAVTLTVASGPREPALTLDAGLPGGSWTRLHPRITRTAGGDWSVTASAPAGAESLRVTWPSGRSATSTGLTRVLLRSIPQQPVFEDPLNDLSLTSAHTADLGIDTTNTSLLGNDPARAFRETAGDGSAQWTISASDAPGGLTGFDAIAYYWPDQPGDPLSFAVSTDGTTWTDVTPTVAETPGAVGGNWTKDVYSVRGLSGIFQVRVTWPDDSTPVWAQQLGDISFYAGSPGQLTAPGAFATTAPADGATEVRGAPTLSWGTAQRASVYRVTVSANADLSSPIESTQTSATSFVPTATLADGTTYYWQVTALNGAGATTTAVASFTTATLPTAPTVAEDFDSFATSADLAAAYVPNSGGGTITPTLVPSGAGAGHGNAMQLAYDLGTAGYAGVSRTFAAPESWWGYDALTLWLDRSQLGAGQTVSVQFMTSDGSFYQATLPDAGPQAAGVVTIPLSDFSPTSFDASAGPADLTSIAQLSFYLGGTGTGTIGIDDVTAVRTTG